MATLDKSTRDLLNEFGKGIGMTGGGSIAALSAMAGVQILSSVCKLTAGKEKYLTIQPDIQEIHQKLQDVYLPKLETVLDADIAAVKNMLRLRIQRDKENDVEKKQVLKVQAQDALHTATDTMLQLSETCIEIMPMALFLYSRALKSAQGDSGIALSSLLSAASSGLYASLKNIQSSKDEAWRSTKQQQVETLMGRLHEYNSIFTARLESIYTKAFS